VILIIAAIVASTRIWLVTITMYEWVLILVLIFGGAGLVAKVLFANNKSEKSKKDKSEQTGGSYTSSVDDELNKMKKNMK
jgi:membrane protein implicated in regulation of membrane protease activity